MSREFRDYLDKSNFLISALIIRSLKYDESRMRLTIDMSRLKDELYFYKYVVKSQKSSIISSLYPVIYGNKNIYSSYEEAVNLFISIRKTITSTEEYGIYLLSLIIKNGNVKKEDIIEFEIENLSKEESIKLQKAKIDSIINFEDILDLMFKYLNEDREYMKIFDNIDIVDQQSNGEYKNMLNFYFENLCQGKMQYRKYESYNMKIIEELFKMEKGERVSCSLFPDGYIATISNDGCEIIVNLKTKNTIYQLYKKV